MKSRRRSGQSLPLLALMMVFLVSMVGLSVDVGNAYGQQRRMQNAANAGAYGGMSAWIASQTDPTGWKNQTIWDNVSQALAGNRVALNTDQYRYRVDYFTSGSANYPLAVWDGTSLHKHPEAGYPYDMNLQPPAGITRMQVTVQERVDTFFARIANWNSFIVNGKADVCFGGYGLGIMPIGMPSSFQEFHDHPRDDESYHRFFNLTEVVSPKPDGKADGAADQLATEIFLPAGTTTIPWPTMQGKIVYIPVANSDDLTGTHIAWLSWTGDGGVPTLETSMRETGNLTLGFTEGPIAKDPIDYSVSPYSPHYNNKLPLNQFMPGDWIHGDTGIKVGTQDELYNLLFKEVTLPFYDVAGKNSGKSTFHSYDLGRFRLVGYELAGGPFGEGGMAPPSDIATSDKYLMFQYIGPAVKGTATLCVP